MDIRRPLNLYKESPLFLRIAIAAVLGIVLGLALGPKAANWTVISDLILQTLRLLATPLIFFGLLHAVLNSDIRGKMVGRLSWALLSNTLIAILVGLALANLMSPGLHVHFPPPTGGLAKKPFDPISDLLGHYPKDFLNPFSTNDLIGIIIVGLSIAIGLRSLRTPETESRIQAISSYVELALHLVLRLLSWVLELVPLAVLVTIAGVVGKTGFQPLVDMAWFVGAVLLGLFLMFGVYLLRLRLSSWVTPKSFVLGGFDALALAWFMVLPLPLFRLRISVPPKRLA